MKDIATVNFTEKLRANPSVAGFHCFERGEWWTQLGETDHRDGPEQTDRPLRDANDRSDLPNRLESPGPNRRNPGKLRIELDRHR
jgi:hypothetical protein